MSGLLDCDFTFLCDQRLPTAVKVKKKDWRHRRQHSDVCINTDPCWCDTQPSETYYLETLFDMLEVAMLLLGFEGGVHYHEFPRQPGRSAFVLLKRET